MLLCLNYPARFMKPSKRIYFLVVEYTNAEQAQNAVNDLQKAYLSEHNEDITTDSKIHRSNFLNIEDGWLEYKLSILDGSKDEVIVI